MISYMRTVHRRLMRRHLNQDIVTSTANAVEIQLITALVEHQNFLYQIFMAGLKAVVHIIVFLAPFGLITKEASRATATVSSSPSPRAVWVTHEGWPLAGHTSPRVTAVPRHRGGRGGRGGREAVYRSGKFVTTSESIMSTSAGRDAAHRCTTASSRD